VNLRSPLMSAGLLLLALCPCWVAACQIPVFRYALERWRPEAIPAVVFHQGPLTKDQESALGALAGDPKAPVNMEVRKIDLSTNLSPAEEKLWAAQGPKAKAALPWLALQSSSGAGDDVRSPVQVAGFDVAAARRLVDSPARRRIAGRLMGGQTAVWVLVEGTKAADNDAAEKLLATELARLEKQLTLPEIDLDTPGPKLRSRLPMRLSFEVLRVSRKDAAESVLVSMLTQGMKPTDSPVVVPVFGQGRALCQLTGVEIAPRQNADVAEFLIGACSCQVKELNPGFDLLLAADWESILEDGGGPAPADERPAGEIPEPVIGSGKPKSAPKGPATGNKLPLRPTRRPS